MPAFAAPLTSCILELQVKRTLVALARGRKMAETANISAIAKKIATDIFGVFFWKLYAQNDANFSCVLDHHLTDTGEQKLTHPGDVVFYYYDPYLNKQIYLHTDLKSYGKSSINQKKIRAALNSLAWTVECAHVSPTWRTKFLKEDQEIYEVRGLLLVANHDNQAPRKFAELLSKISKTNIAVAESQVLHVLGPDAITDLYAVATDIKLLKHDNSLPANYRFFYPDLTLWKRHSADDERTGATIELLMSPFFIIKHGAVVVDGNPLTNAGSLVYYSRKGETVEEFVYLLDSLSRYQLVNSKEQIRIRAFNPERSPEIKNNFDKAKVRYCSSWGFEGNREAEINAITIDSVQQNNPNYSPDEIGWFE